MILQNEICYIEINIDETDTVGSADNRHYDVTLNPGDCLIALAFCKFMEHQIGKENIFFFTWETFQARVVEKMATAIPLALDGGLRQPKVAVCVILASWEHGNPKTATSIYYSIT